MPLPAIPVIAATIARVAAVVGRVAGPLLARGGATAARAAPTMAAATRAATTAPATVRGVAAAGTRAGAAASQAMASTPNVAAARTPAQAAARQAASAATQATVNVNVQQAGQQVVRAPRWRGGPVSPASPPAAPASGGDPPNPSTLQRAFGPLMNLVRPSGAGQQAAQQAASQGGASARWQNAINTLGQGSGTQQAQQAQQTQQAAQQASQQAGQNAQQTSFQGSSRAAQNAAQRFAQRGASLYQNMSHQSQRERQRDAIEFNKNLSAGIEALKNYDPKALAHWGKAAGIGLKYMASVLLGPVGVTIALALLPKKLRDFGDALLEARRPLAELHGGQAATFARLDVERLGRNIRFANMTSGSTENLARAVSRLEERLLPYAAAAVNVLNNLFVVAERISAVIGGAIDILHPELKIITRLLAKDDGGKTSGDLAQFALSMQQGEFFKRRKPPEPPKDKKDKPGYDGPFMG